MSKKTDSTAVKQRSPNVPAELLEQYERDAGQGLETMGAEDRAIPFIALIQSLSPQRKRDNAKYIEGAEEGDLFNTVTGELFKGDAGITVVPVFYQKRYNVWTPRDEGGGFRGSFAAREEAGDSKLDLETRKYVLENGDEIVDTAEHYVLARSLDGAWSPALISMTSTKLSVSRQWNTRMSMVKVPGTDITPPIYAKTYTLRSAPKENRKGSFYVYVIDDGDFVDKALYTAAKSFREALLKGAVRVDYNKAEDDSDVEAAGADGPAY